MAKPSLLFDDALTVAEAQHKARVTERTIRRWIAQGLLPAYRVGPRRILINSADLDALVRGAA